MSNREKGKENTDQTDCSWKFQCKMHLPPRGTNAGEGTETEAPYSPASGKAVKINGD